MVDFRQLADRAKKIVDRRGGTESLKEDAEELKDIAKGKGSLKDKAKAAGDGSRIPARPATRGSRRRPGSSAQQRPPE